MLYSLKYVKSAKAATDVPTSASQVLLGLVDPAKSFIHALGRRIHLSAPPMA